MRHPQTEYPVGQEVNFISDQPEPSPVTQRGRAAESVNEDVERHFSENCDVFEFSRDEFKGVVAQTEYARDAVGDDEGVVAALEGVFRKQVQVEQSPEATPRCNNQRSGHNNRKHNVQEKALGNLLKQQ